MATGDRQHQGVMLPTDSPQGDALPKALRLLVPTAGASLGWWAGAPWPLVVLAGAVVAVRLVRLLVLELEQLGRDLERLPASWRWVHRAKATGGTEAEAAARTDGRRTPAQLRRPRRRDVNDPATASARFAGRQQS